MKITIILSDIDHPIKSYLEKWINDNSSKHEIIICHSPQEVKAGDILFLVSCSEIIRQKIRNQFTKTFVIHSSSLPKGRGWSPHIWSILEGKNKITVSVIEAMDKVDTGDIWAQTQIIFEVHELYDEINHKLFIAELNLMTIVINNINSLSPKKQRGNPGPYYRKRTPKDSEIDILKNIDEQFQKLRVADSKRYPAYFIKNGIKYIVKIKKEDN